MPIQVTSSTSSNCVELLAPEKKHNTGGGSNTGTNLPVSQIQKYHQSSMAFGNEPFQYAISSAQTQQLSMNCGYPFSYSSNNKKINNFFYLKIMLFFFFS